MQIHRDNFYENTSVVFHQVVNGLQNLRRGADYISYGKNKKGKLFPSSRYWFGVDEGGEYVYRMSSHWVNVITSDLSVFNDCPSIRDCMWDIRLLPGYEYNKSGTYFGKAYYKDFKIN